MTGLSLNNNEMEKVAGGAEFNFAPLVEGGGWEPVNVTDIKVDTKKDSMFHRGDLLELKDGRIGIVTSILSWNWKIYSLDYIDGGSGECLAIEVVSVKHCDYEQYFMWKLANNR